MTRRPGLIVFAVAALATTAAHASEMPAPRVGSQKGYTRLVLDLPAGVGHRVEPLGAALRVTLVGASSRAALVKFPHAELSAYSVEPRGVDTILTAVTPQGVSSRSGYRVSVLPAAGGKTGSRLVIDLSGAFADTRPLGPVLPLQLNNGAGRFSIVLDAGHGGNDPGAIGPTDETTVNLQVARRVGAILTRAGVDVAYTRTDDRALSRDKRSDLASRAALAGGRTAFVSIHANAVAPVRAAITSGIEVYYSGPQNRKAEFPAPGAAPVPATLTSIAAPASPLAVSATPEPVPTEATAEPLEQTIQTADTELEASPEVMSPETDSSLRPAGSQAPPQPAPPANEPFVPTLLATAEPEEHAPSAPEVASSIPQPVVVPEVMMQPPAPAISSISRTELSRRMATRVLRSVLGATAAQNRGARTADFFVVRQAQTPAILVEMGYLTHPIEGLNLTNPGYLDRIAYGIGRGVLEYLDEELLASD